MKNQIINEEVLYKLKDSFLEEALFEYFKAKKNASTYEGKEICIDALHKVFDILSYRTLALPLEIKFLDNKLQCLFKKGRLPNDIDLFNNEKVKSSPVYANVRKQGTDDAYQKYITVLSSVRRLKDIECFNTVKEVTLKEVFNEFIKNDSNVSGVLINPKSENIFITKEIMDVICNDLNTPKWHDIGANLINYY